MRLTTHQVPCREDLSLIHIFRKDQNAPVISFANKTACCLLRFQHRRWQDIAPPGGIVTSGPFARKGIRRLREGQFRYHDALQRGARRVEPFPEALQSEKGQMLVGEEVIAQEMCIRDRTSTVLGIFKSFRRWAGNALKTTFRKGSVYQPHRLMLRNGGLRAKIYGVKTLPLAKDPP